MNSHGIKMFEMYDIFVRAESIVSKYYKDKNLIPYIDNYVFTKGMTIEDYSHLPEIKDIYYDIMAINPKIKGFILSPVLDKDNKPLMIETRPHFYETYISKIKQMIIDDYDVYRTKYNIEYNGKEEKELVAYKDIISITEPSMMSTSGKAIFKLFDNESRSIQFYETEYINKIMDIENDKSFYDWDESDFMMLKLALPNMVS